MYIDRNFVALAHTMACLLQSLRMSKYFELGLSIGNRIERKRRSTNVGDKLFYKTISGVTNQDRGQKSCWATHSTSVHLLLL